MAAISEGLWSLYHPLICCFMDWAMDYLSEIQLTLNTYIARAPAAFVLEPQRPRALLGIVQRVLDFSNAQDQDVQVCVCVCVRVYVFMDDNIATNRRRAISRTAWCTEPSTLNPKPSRCRRRAISHRAWCCTVRAPSRSTYSPLLF